LVVGFTQPFAGKAARMPPTKSLPTRTECCYSRFDTSENTMRRFAFFTFYFWFSHSSPQAVE